MSSYNHFGCPWCGGQFNGENCLGCSSVGSGNEFVYDPNLYSYNETPNFFNQPQRHQYETYSCELCGDSPHYGFDCQTRTSIFYEQEPCYNQNFSDNYYPQNSSSFPQQDLCCENCGGPHELVEYINTPGWNRPAFCNNGDDDDEDSTIAVTPDFLITESLIMENEHLDTIPKTESDEFIKSSVENLVSIPSESEDFFDIESECDMPDCDDSQTTNVSTFSNPLFDDSTSSDDESSHEESDGDVGFHLLPHGPMNSRNWVKLSDLKQALRGRRPMLIRIVQYSRKCEDSCQMILYSVFISSASIGNHVYMEQPEGFVNPKYPNRSVKTYLGRCFAMKYLGKAAYILGIKIYRDRSRRLIRLCQSAYIKKILKRYYMENSKRGSILMQEKLKLSKSQGASTPDELKHMQNVPYASVVGSIMYAVRCTRPDFAFAQNVTSRFQQNPEAEYIASFVASKEAV
uniref:Retrotransposon protein, putative, Ty1-copia subclass n=1 Tax=Tanacetum cinerariifolium TaxID=118510 RepID=A0A6L2P604_TANCI|nr:retrotransposon protein, putative, Ty1-copia subclass [Tanacetum cinerariifolium]